MQLAGDEDNQDAGTESWINMLDRGGLWHVNDEVYELFVSMLNKSLPLFAFLHQDRRQWQR